MDTNEPEAKRDEVQLKPLAFDDEMLVVCYVLDITVHYKMVMRNMRCFATVDDTIKACNIIIQRHQLDQRLSEQTWSKLLLFTKWRAKNQDTAIHLFLDYYDDYTVDGEKLDDNIMYILRKIEATHGDRRKQDKIFTMIDLQKIDEETVNKKKRPAQEKENSLSKKRTQPKREESKTARMRNMRCFDTVDDKRWTCLINL